VLGGSAFLDKRGGTSWSIQRQAKGGIPNRAKAGVASVVNC